MLSVSLSLCRPRLNQLVDFYEIQYGGQVIKGDLDAMPLIP
jgi:hypothetical protein